MKRFKAVLLVYVSIGLGSLYGYEWIPDESTHESSTSSDSYTEALVEQEAAQKAIMQAEYDASFPSAFTEEDKKNFNWLLQDSLTRLQNALNANPDPGAYVSILSRAIHNYLLEGLDQYLPGDTSHEFDTFEQNEANGARALFKKMELNTIEDVEDLEDTVERLERIVVRRFPNAQPFFTEAINMLSLKPKIGGLSSVSGTVPNITLGDGQ